MSWEHISRNFREVGEQIERAAESAGRDPASVTLVAVTKTFPVEAVRAAYDLGHRHFGESRLQEAQPKIEALPSDTVWHFIGKLQSNKAKRVAQLFDVIQTLESETQLKEIAKAGRAVEALVEVNVANEAQKSGLPLESLDLFLVKLLDFPQARFRGLMTIGPATDNAEEMRPIFRSLREANARVGGQWLSMGMSGNFEVAIQEGASHVRIGTALFGAR
jgi:pyridoxal phosphate enzyme (YggS family)